MLIAYGFVTLAVVTQAVSYVNARRTLQRLYDDEIDNLEDFEGDESFLAVVYAGCPSFYSFMSSKIPEDIRNEICLQQSKIKPTNCFETSKYRTINGSCNNRENPLWGTPNSPFARLLPAHYSDNYSAFAKSVTGNELPNARILSTQVFGSESQPDNDYTIAMMQFGQFMAHDMSLTFLSSSPSCCSYSGHWQSNLPTCMDIKIPYNDTFYNPHKVVCMNFTSTVSDHDLNCHGIENRPSQPLSSVTSYLDLSTIYGNSDEQSRFLRSLSGGRLKTEKIEGHDYPQHDPKATENCFTDSDSDTCFISGDIRINQSPHLLIIHILFIREHNRLAKELSKLNPQWKDEKLFQESRRINIAQYQQIVYYEWLTIFLGRENMKKFGIIYDVDGDAYVNDYNSSVNSAVYNEHSQAAFRFFHSQIEGHLNLLTESREILSTIPLSDHFDNPNITVEQFDNLARGMMTQKSQKSDKNFDPEITKFLFKHQRKFGDDLRAIDIQRGRDHGVASYNDVRKFCGLKVATKWEDFSDLIESEDLAKLMEIYEDFRDVELSVGGLLETQIDNTTLAGPTLLCIFNKQFLNARVGDRFWFESGDPEVAFEREQLKEIRKSSFARIFCDNSHNVRNVQRRAFDTVDDESNPIVSCDEIPAVDLTKWTEL